MEEPRVITFTTGAVLRVIGLVVLLGLLWTIRDIVLSVFTALLLAGLLYPLAEWAERYRIPKGLAVFVCYVALFGVLAAAFLLLIPAILDQARQLLTTYGGGWDALQQALDLVRRLTEQYGITDNLADSLASIPTQASRAASGLFGALTDLFGGLANIILVVVLSFYMVIASKEAKDLFRWIIPPQHQEFGEQLVWRVIERLGAWLRGQLVLGLLIGALCFVGYIVVGVPYPLLLALLAGVLEFLPYIGPFIAVVPAVFLAFTVSPWHAVATLVVFIIIQQLENHVVVPMVMRRAVGLNPVVSIVAFLIGVRLFGLVGAIFAIPVATAAHVAFSEWLRYRSKIGEA